MDTCNIISVQASLDLLHEHYSALASKPFFADLCAYMSSGPVVPMVRECRQLSMGCALYGSMQWCVVIAVSQKWQELCVPYMLDDPEMLSVLCNADFCILVVLTNLSLTIFLDFTFFFPVLCFYFGVVCFSCLIWLMHLIGSFTRIVTSWVVFVCQGRVLIV